MTNQPERILLNGLPPREQGAIEAYFRVLSSKGATEATLGKRAELLALFVPQLGKVALDGDAYRTVVEKIQCTLDSLQCQVFLNVIREFFWFWIEDIKSIAALRADQDYDPDLTDIKAYESELKQLWKALDGEKFSTVELWPIKAYTHALNEQAAPQELVDTRIKLVKLIVVRMRSMADLNNRQYRVAVDSLICSFKTAEPRRLFLGVAREFFHFWIGDPEAVKYIRLQYGTQVFI